MGTPQLVAVDSDTYAFPAPVTAAFDARNDKRYRGVSDPAVTITVEHKVAPAGYSYAVTRARTGGRFVPGLVDKRYANDFDVANPTVTGASFIPGSERVDSYAVRTGSTVATNASGFKTSGNIGEMRGAQIRNGKIFHDFEANNLDGSPQGIEGMGYRVDGKLKCYSALRGDTAATMVADGVVHSWSFGPNLVVEGVPQDLTLKNWQYFLTEVSARQIIGQSVSGDIIIITIVGKSGTIGIAGNDMVSLAVTEGCYNASTFDGGGSSQTYVQGFYTIPSSDDATGMDGTLGRRKVGDSFLVRGSLATAAIDTGWRLLPLRSGFTAYVAANPPMIRQLNGTIELRGFVKPTTGNFSTTADQVIADIPQQFRSYALPKAFDGPGAGSFRRKINVNADFSVTVISDANGTAYVGLDPVRWGADTIL